MSNNILLKKNQEPFGTVPFKEISTEDYIPAIIEAIKVNEEEINSIVNDASKPDFNNTILALEMSGDLLDNIATIYYHLFGSESDADFQKLADEISPMLAKLENDINLNADLFKRVEDVYNNEYNQMDKDEKKLTEIIYKDFVRNGANLDSDDKEKLREIDNKLSTLSPSAPLLIKSHL